MTMTELSIEIGLARSWMANETKKENISYMYVVNTLTEQTARKQQKKIGSR